MFKISIIKRSRIKMWLKSFLAVSTYTCLFWLYYSPAALAQNFGFNIQIPDSIEDFIEDIENIIGDIETFLSRQGIEIENGEIGLPDIEQAKVIFESDPQLDEYSDLFGSQTGSTFSNRDKLLQQYLRDYSQQYAENTVLSQEGQEKIAEKMNTIDEIVANSIELAEDSAGQDVSQNILRNLSSQETWGHQLDALILFELQESKINRSLQLEMTSEFLTETSKSTTRAEREYISTNKTILNGMPFVILPRERN